MGYSIEFRPAVLKNLKRFPKKDLIRINKKIEALGSNLPNPSQTKMKGENPFHIRGIAIIVNTVFTAWKGNAHGTMQLVKHGCL
jgi:hypothetical protein